MSTFIFPLLASASVAGYPQGSQKAHGNIYAPTSGVPPSRSLVRGWWRDRPKVSPNRLVSELIAQLGQMLYPKSTSVMRVRTLRMRTKQTAVLAENQAPQQCETRKTPHQTVARAPLLLKINTKTKT